MTQLIRIMTTVDITPTGVRRKSDDPDWLLKRNQQRNHDTLLQVIGLRTQPLDVTCDITLGYWQLKETLHMSEKSEVRLWTLKFHVERQDVLGPNGELFLSDINVVPLVPALTETLPIFPPQFIVRGELKNIDILVQDLL